VPKQFRDLSGVPVLRSALEPFLSHPNVIFTVAVVPPDVARKPPAWLAEMIGLRFGVVAGGSERTHSVRAGLAALPVAASVVLVHDGARPFPSRDVIDQVIAVARTGRAAIAAIPLGDTLKEAERTDEGVVVRRTIPRDELWRAQTPQGFPRALLVEACPGAGSMPPTTPNSERLGKPVVLVPDVPTNLKITTLEDLEMADALIARRLSPR
jgi:2-C-methyl-D-erythritol 4-phosphate cytidylyltransferase